MSSSTFPVSLEHFRLFGRHICLFIDTWLPKMLNVPVTQAGVEITQDIPGFDHLPLMIRSDVLSFPEAERKASKMLVRYLLVDLTAKLDPRRNGRK